MAQTSGLLQQLKWAGDSVLAYVGPSLRAVQVLVLRFDPGDPGMLATRRAMSALLVRSLTSGLPVTLTHASGATQIDGVDVRFADVRVDAIEVSQSIQDLAHAVPLIALKPTVVRVYLSSRRAAAITVSGTLAVRRGGTTRLVSSLNVTTLNPAEFGQVDTFRDTAAKSLNFQLPTDQTAAGDAEVRLASLTEVGTGASVNFGPPGFIDTFDFTAAAPLRLAVVGFSYQAGSPAQTFTPTTTDFGLLTSWLRRAYPVAQVIASTQVVTASAAVPFSCGAINAELAAIRALDVSAGVDARTHYYGLVADGGFFMRGCATIAGSPDPTAVGSGPTGTGSWGWDFDGSYGDWYGGHELGHTFGRLHPGFCGESNDDNNYPFSGGQLATNTGSYAGLDVGDSIWGRPLTALPGTQWHDVMTYCNRQWLSSYTYAAIRARLAAENALAPGPGAGSGRPDDRFPDGVKGVEGRPTRPRTLVSLVAQVDLTTSKGTIAFVNPVARGEVAVADATGPVMIRTLDGKGKVLGEYRIGVKRFSREEPGQDEQALADVILPFDADTVAVELHVNDRLADTFRTSGEPIEDEVTQVDARAGGIELTWGTGPKRRAIKPGGPTHNVQISGDGGRTWRTVAVGVRGRSVIIPAEAMPAQGTALVRVQVSDGLRARETTIEWPLRRERLEASPSD